MQHWRLIIIHSVLGELISLTSSGNYDDDVKMMLTISDNSVTFNILFNKYLLLFSKIVRREIVLELELELI